MTFVNRQRLAAGVLLVIAFLTLAASRAFPFMDNVPVVVKTAVVVAGVVCVLVAVPLWLRRGPGSEE